MRIKSPAAVEPAAFRDTLTESAVPDVAAVAKFAVTFKSVAFAIPTDVPAATLLKTIVSSAVVAPKPETCNAVALELSALIVSVSAEPVAPSVTATFRFSSL